MAKEKNESLIEGYESELRSAVQQKGPKKYIDDIKKALKAAGGKVEVAEKDLKSENTSKKTKTTKK